MYKRTVHNITEKNGINILKIRTNNNANKPNIKTVCNVFLLFILPIYNL